MFSMIHHMDLLARTAGREGLLALEEAAKEIPTEIGFFHDMQSAVFYVCDSLDYEDIIEILTARYWIKNLQGEDALLYFMMILSILRIQDGATPSLLECLLMACLSDDAAEQYIKYKRQRQLKKQEQTPVA